MREPIEIYCFMNCGEIDAVCSAEEVRKLEDEHNELLEKCEKQEKRIELLLQTAERYKRMYCYAQYGEYKGGDE